jgi:hypothetical protein
MKIKMKTPAVFLALLGALILTGPASFADQPLMNKTALSGQTIKIYNVTSVNPDCTSAEPVTLRLLQMPSHGRAEVTNDSVFPNFPADNPRSACNHTKFPSVSILYASAPNFVGTDILSFEVFTSNGGDTNEIKVLITVK